LNELESVHGEERTFSSDVCNKSFSLKVNLKNHQCIHSGEKQVCYDVCNKSFRHRNNMKCHCHIHMRSRPLL
jgi:hypothetical protein